MADRRYDMAVGMMDGGDYNAAADLLFDALSFAPKWPPLCFQLGEVLRHLNRFEDAQKYFDDYLHLDPDDAMGAKIKLSLMGYYDPRSAITKTYVKNLFDQYAPKFEKSLVEHLGYEIPKLMAHHIDGHFGHLLDLGCGTGLVGDFFSGRAKTITGVDLSAGMIDLARKKGIYETLLVMDIQDFLSQTTNTFDLILCADVLIYLSDVSRLFENISRVMGQNCIFSFSTQDHDGPEDWILGQDHRYAHSQNYIHTLLKENHLNLTHEIPCNLRKDGHNMIKGRLYLVNNHGFCQSGFHDPA